MVFIYEKNTKTVMQDPDMKQMISYLVYVLDCQPVVNYCDRESEFLCVLAQRM